MQRRGPAIANTFIDLQLEEDDLSRGTSPPKELISPSIELADSQSPSRKFGSSNELTEEDE